MKYEDGFYLQVQLNGDHSIVEKSHDEWSVLGSDEPYYDEAMINSSIALYRINKVIDFEGNNLKVEI